MRIGLSSLDSVQWEKCKLYVGEAGRKDWKLLVCSKDRMQNMESMIDNLVYQLLDFEASMKERQVGSFRKNGVNLQPGI